MASIELDIIKQRCDKLMPEEKRELIEYLATSLADEPADQNDTNINGLSDDSELVS